MCSRRGLAAQAVRGGWGPCQQLATITTAEQGPIQAVRPGTRWLGVPEWGARQLGRSPREAWHRLL
uniref:Uncharacterized protein n=1 Tax=Spironucleus salmonicida TaxID=348837 RepID=V6LF46_9EUKA|eukprot:EST42898.1 Hypothetical protein SS50377_17431 [Spironucleus salmonicida]